MKRKSDDQQYMNNDKIDLTFASGFRVAVGALIALALYGSLVHHAIGVRPRDVRAACVGHDGVSSTRNIDWALSEYGAVSIVCRDGYYTTR